MDENEKIIGIDLGTTNSAAYIFDVDNPKLIKSDDGSTSFPSVVLWKVNEDGEGSWLVGNRAKKQAVSNPGNTFSEFKRYMGSNEEFKFEDNKNKFIPQDLAALILGEIKRVAEEEYGSINKAVIGYPAGFNDIQRNATKNAAEFVFDEVKMIKEPTAACLSYVFNKNYLNGNILVFDMGGGTTDVVLGEWDDLNQKLDVKSSKGNEVLGGKDMTTKLYEYIKTDFESKYNIYLKDFVKDENNPGHDIRVKLRSEVEEAKIRLSSQEFTDIFIDSFITTDDGKHIDLDVELNRSTLENLVEDDLEECGELINCVLDDVNMSSDDIDYLVLVGGPTQMPCVKEYVEGIFNLEAVHINPMLSVAEGLAIYGGISEGATEIEIIDRNPLTLGTVFNGTDTEQIILRNTILPATETINVRPAKDYQSFVNIKIIEGEYPIAEYNHQIGVLRLEDLPKKPKKDVSIDLTLNINEDGIIEASAIEKNSGVSKSVTFEAEGRLSKEEILIHRRGYKENESHIKRIIKIKKLINSAYKSINKAKALIKDGSKLMCDDKEVLEGLIIEVSRLINEKEYKELKFSLDELNEVIDEINSGDFL